MNKRFFDPEITKEEDAYAFYSGQILLDTCKEEANITQEELV